MYRNVINDLAAWYEEPRRRILYVKGAYGVGKTWTIKDFATAFFSEQIYMDLSSDNSLWELLTAYDNIDTVTEKLDNLLEKRFKKINEKDTLIIFDEVQSIPNCGELFYAFRKKHRDYNICLIASSMQITEYEYHHRDVYNIIRMRPMTFDEYMIANKATPLVSAIEQSKSTPLKPMEIEAAQTMLRDYLLIGGMPGIVSHYIKNKDFDSVRKKQFELLEYYESLIKKSFSHAMYQRTKRIWKSIPLQLARHNKKFMYKYAEENARSREYSESTQHLCDLGLARKLPRLKQGLIPLEDHADYKSFELFLLDHGLLRAMYDLPIQDSMNLADILNEKNGAIAEQFIFQELSNKVGYLYYWISGATARVPFVYEGDNSPVPVDIRFYPNPKAQNIKTFRSQNTSTEISIKVSLDPVAIDNKILTIPAYGLWNM